MISSPLMTSSYERTIPDYTAHNARELPGAEETDWAEEPDGAEETDRAQLDPSLALFRRARASR